MSEILRGSEFYLPEVAQSLTLVDTVPERAMVVCAHPDDAEIGCGATLVRWVLGGCDVVLVVCTDGAKGLQQDDDIALRRREQAAACDVLGVEALEFLHHVDGSLEDDAEFRGEIVELIRRYRPNFLLTHDPIRSWGLLHRDHRIVGQVGMDAVYPFARDVSHYPEQIAGGLGVHKVAQVWLWGGDVFDTAVNVAGCVARQAEALSCHRSQIAGLNSGEDTLADVLHQRAAGVARNQPVEHAEVYRRLIVRD